MARELKLTLKLFVDEAKKRVVFAEADKDFVDVLLSFLTLPMGTIIRLLDKQSNLVCMDNLYNSVLDLDTRYLQTEACKAMLLRPTSSALDRYKKLKVSIDDTRAREFYTCQRPNCFNGKLCLYSSVRNALCRDCGQIMDSVWIDDDETVGNTVSHLDGVFVKGTVSFMITDDLHVTPCTSNKVLDILDKLGIEGIHYLQVKIMDLGKEDILVLLQRSLVGKMPLSDLYFREPEKVDDLVESDYMKIGARVAFEEDSISSMKSEIILVKFIFDPSSEDVVYVEAGEDFVNLLFSFLTFPLGAIIERLDENSSIGCIGNVYTSVECLSSNGNDFMISEESKSCLLDPTLAPYFGCSNQLLRIGEEWAGKFSSCRACFGCSFKCNHKVANPDGRFMTGREEHKVYIGQSEARSLLSACMNLNSRNPLTDFLLSHRMMRKDKRQRV